MNGENVASCVRIHSFGDGCGADVAKALEAGVESGCIVLLGSRGRCTAVLCTKRVRLSEGAGGAVGQTVGRMRHALNWRWHTKAAWLDMAHGR